LIRSTINACRAPTQISSNLQPLLLRHECHKISESTHSVYAEWDLGGLVAICQREERHSRSKARLNSGKAVLSDGTVLRD
jgi:hypothetical protein